jgi:hypothetical protein
MHHSVFLGSGLLPFRTTLHTAISRLASPSTLLWALKRTPQRHRDFIANAFILADLLLALLTTGAPAPLLPVPRTRGSLDRKYMRPCPRQAENTSGSNNQDSPTHRFICTCFACNDADRFGSSRNVFVASNISLPQRLPASSIFSFLLVV